MYQIFRIIKPEIMQICRFYGSQRNLHSHYETLRVAPSASQKDIRLAFIKLSKEMHPDLSKKAGHTDFVKISEAYKVLSKECTRRLYDMELNNRGPNGRPIRVVYYDPTIKEWYPPKMSPRGPNSDNYYEVKRGKKFSKVTIALVCVVISGIGTAIQVLLIKKSLILRREALLDERRKYAEEYRKERIEAESKDREQRIAEFEDKFSTHEADAKVGLQS